MYSSRRQQTKAQGIILKRKSFRDHDWMFTILTSDLGKLTVIARGARRLWSKRLTSLSIFNQVDLVLYQSKPDSLYSLSEVSLLNDYPFLKDRLPTLSNVWHGIELVNKLYPENQPASDVFTLTIAWLAVIDQPQSALSDSQASLVTKAYIIKLLKLAGFWPSKIDNSPKLDKSLSWLSKAELTELSELKLTNDQIEYLNIIDNYLEGTELELFNKPTNARQLLN